MEVSVQTGIVGLLSGMATLLLGDLLRRWRTKGEIKRVDAEVRSVDAAADQRTMEAMTNAFRVISERQADDINDLRERLRRVEDALMLAHQRSELLVAENEELKANIALLRDERDQLAGEVRELKQVAASAVRVYGQAGSEKGND